MAKKTKTREELELNVRLVAQTLADEAAMVYAHAKRYGWPDPSEMTDEERETFGEMLANQD